MKVARHSFLLSVVAAVLLLAGVSTAATRKYTIDTQASALSIHVLKGGAFSNLGHEHLLVPGQWEGTLEVDPSSAKNARVVVRVFAGSLEDIEPGLSEADRAKVNEQTRTHVLEAERFPVIEFTADSVVLSGRDSEDRGGHEGKEEQDPSLEGTWVGELTLHGYRSPLRVPFHATVQTPGIWADGKVMLNLPHYGIKPPSAGLGTVKTKENVWVHFQLRFRPVG